MIPSSVWRINIDPPPDHTASFAAKGDDKWWDQVDLVKLILAANQIKEISDDIRFLTALTVLDVRKGILKVRQRYIWVMVYGIWNHLSPES